MIIYSEFLNFSGTIRYVSDCRTDFIPCSAYSVCTLTTEEEYTKGHSRPSGTCDMKSAFLLCGAFIL